MKLFNLYILMKLIVAYNLENFTNSESDQQGSSSPTIDPERSLQRIIGGTVTSIKDAPYMAAILYENKLKCGAGILTKLFVVTAAHCLRNIKDMSDLKIRIGSDDYATGGQERGVIYMVSHPKFDERTGDYDCAVLRVDTAFEKSPPYQELDFPAVNRIMGEKLLVSGWGVTSERGKLSRTLQSINVTVLQDIICYDYYRKIGWRLPIPDFCAGNLEGGRDSCSGDSGGPAVRNNTVLIGIVSLGHRCARPGVPALYTNVYELSNWIYTKIHS